MAKQKPSLEDLGLEVDVPPVKDIKPLTVEDVQSPFEAIQSVKKPAVKETPVVPPIPKRSVEVTPMVRVDIAKLWAWLAELFVGHAVGIGVMGAILSIDAWLTRTTRVMDDMEVFVQVHQLNQISGLLVGIGLMLVASLFLVAGVGLVVAASNRADSDGLTRSKRSLLLRIGIFLGTLSIYAAAIVVGPFVVVLFAFLILAICTTQCVFYQSV